MKLYFNLFKNFYLCKSSKSIIAKDKDHLKKLINKRIFIRGKKCDLNHIDVSNITDMSELFYNSNFNGDISKWNMSNVTNMYCMFLGSEFNSDVSTWNTSKVSNMSGLFFESKFNQDIFQWDISNVTEMHGMFQRSNFNKYLTDWKPYQLKDKKGMFDKCIAPKPYWYLAENTQRAIELYELNEQLNRSLSNSAKKEYRVKL